MVQTSYCLHPVYPSWAPSVWYSMVPFILSTYLSTERLVLDGPFILSTHISIWYLIVPYSNSASGFRPLSCLPKWVYGIRWFLFPVYCTYLSFWQSVISFSSLLNLPEQLAFRGFFFLSSVPTWSSGNRLLLFPVYCTYLSIWHSMVSFILSAYISIWYLMVPFILLYLTTASGFRPLSCLPKWASDIRWFPLYCLPTWASGNRWFLFPVYCTYLSIWHSVVSFFCLLYLRDHLAIGLLLFPVSCTYLNICPRCPLILSTNLSIWYSMVPFIVSCRRGTGTANIPGKRPFPK